MVIRFIIFSYGVHPPSWILCEVTFYHSDIFEIQLTIRVQNLAKKNLFSNRNTTKNESQYGGH